MSNLKKQLFLLFFALILFSACDNTPPEQVSLSGLLDEMVSYDESARFPAVFFKTGMESSYDRRSVSPDDSQWFANNDGFGYIRLDSIEGRAEKVLFDRAGPGVITRFWQTTTEKTGILRFYFDDSTEPMLVADAFDLSRLELPIGDVLLQKHTSYEENGKGGTTLFLPIPYTKRCKITLEEPDKSKQIPRYYQINYRTYPKGTTVEAFSPEVLQKNKKKIKQTEELLVNPPIPTGMTYAIQEELIPHKWKTSVPQHPESEGKHYSFRYGIQAEKEGGCLRQVKINVSMPDSADYTHTMRSIILKISFDGKRSVYVPLSDFSGGGIGAPAIKNWYLQADGKGSVDSRWVMPFRNKSEFEIVNESNVPVKINLDVVSDDWKWDDRSLYFFASWHQGKDMTLVSDYMDPDAESWQAAFLWGKGVFKGDVLSIYNYSPKWYGEGDDKITVDFEVFPSHHGTGTEDYYNCSWAPVVPFQTPFGGAPRADNPSSQGYNTFFRTRNLDNIPFNDRLYFWFELLSWEKGKIDCSSTIYWYGNMDADIIGSQNIEEEASMPLPPAIITK